MKIDGVAANILQYIWWSGYWEREYVPEDANTGGFIYTLTVTDELLENLKYHKKPKQP